MTNPITADTKKAATSWWKRYLYGLVAAEISTTARYCDHMIQLCPLEHDDGLLMAAIQLRKVGAKPFCSALSK